MDAISALVAGLLSGLHRSIAPSFCPGEWPWAVSLFGVLVGLLPGVGAMFVALLRKATGNAGSVISAAIGFVFAGLIPLLLFTVTGRVFAAAAAGLSVPGLSQAGLRSDACFVLGTQAEYLGHGTVGQTFMGTSPLRLGLGLVGLAIVPVVVAVFTYVQARVALRRGPRWPATLFWLPTLGVAVLTMAAPAATAAHLWLGAGLGALAGIFLPLLVGPPSWAAVGRAPAQPSSATGRRAPAQASSATGRRAAAAGPGQAAAPTRPPTRPPVSAGPVRSTPSRVRATAPPVAHRPTVARPPGHPTRGGPGAPNSGAPRSPRFQLVRRLGSGGFGRVWLARDAKLGHVVALKAAHAPDAETEQRIQREAGALAAIRHPNCVRIFDLVRASDDPGLSEMDGMVIVMGYVEGPSLGDRVRDQGLLDDIAAARIWVNLAGALDAAHSRGVMHRDVKPGNVVIDPHGVAHLIDFGIARKTGDATMTQTGFVLGTPDFLAPEIACGERASASSDSWQLAATISYALTGHPPRGGHADAVSGLRAAATGAALSHLPKRTAHLALLRAAMDNDPARRPALRDVARALDDWLRRAGTTPSGRPAPARSR